MWYERVYSMERELIDIYSYGYTSIRRIAGDGFAQFEMDALERKLIRRTVKSDDWRFADLFHL